MQQLTEAGLGRQVLMMSHRGFQLQLMELIVDQVIGIIKTCTCSSDIRATCDIIMTSDTEETRRDIK